VPQIRDCDDHQVVTRDVRVRGETAEYGKRGEEQEDVAELQGDSEGASGEGLEAVGDDGGNLGSGVGLGRGEEGIRSADSGGGVRWRVGAENWESGVYRARGSSTLKRICG
jgi:hypothetical protein